MILFDPFALPSPCETVTGHMLRMIETMVIQNDHDSAEERFIVADGNRTMWLVYTYDYVGRRAN